MSTKINKLATMREDTSEPFGELLRAHRSGDVEAGERLFMMIYGRLKHIARRQLRDRRPGMTLNTTALVHEAYMKLVDPSLVAAQDRAHFLAISARAMREIIIDYVRRRSAAKRGGGVPNLTLDENRIAVQEHVSRLIALDDTMKRLSAFDERLTRIVECRFFAGLTEQETAEAVGSSPRTVRRDWKRARAWLQKYMDD